MNEMSRYVTVVEPRRELGKRMTIDPPNYREGAKVSWSSCGSWDTEYARKFALAVLSACDQADATNSGLIITGVDDNDKPVPENRMFS